MKKILVLGATGMAGHMISSYFKTLIEKYEVYDICHSVKLEEKSILIDIHDLNLLKTTIVGLKPDIIINSIGILNKNAEDDPCNTIFINSYLPRYLEDQFKNSNIRLIQISTDCVFSGDKGNYNEASVPDGIDLYAQTKLLGEINNSKDLTVRTSIIGPELKQNGKGLFHWFMKQNDTAIGYSKVIWSGVTTLQLGKSLDIMIENNLNGLYNLTSKVPINKYELLKLINSIFDKNILIKNFEEIENDKSLISIRDDFSVELPDYKEMLSELRDWMVENRQLYSQYFSNTYGETLYV